MSDRTMKTKGGYEIKGFVMLHNPIKRGILPPLEFEGCIFDPVLGEHVTIQYEKSGKCSNYQRSDCFVDEEFTPLT